MVRRKSVFPMLRANPTRVWDTFAEPNNLNNTECSFRTKSGLITPFGVTSPKKQVNRGRLRMTAAQNLSYGVQKHLTKSSGLFYFFLCEKKFRTLLVRSSLIQRSSAELAMDGIVVVSFLQAMWTNLGCDFLFVLLRNHFSRNNSRWNGNDTVAQNHNDRCQRLPYSCLGRDISVAYGRHRADRPINTFWNAGKSVFRTFDQIH